MNLDGTETVIVKDSKGVEHSIELKEILKHCVDLKTQQRINQQIIGMVQALELKLNRKNIFYRIKHFFKKEEVTKVEPFKK